ncbi:MAG: hypothetical protein WC897_04305 [Candidatus Gracilibacteria bacterium]
MATKLKIGEDPDEIDGSFEIADDDSVSAGGTIKSENSLLPSTDFKIIDGEVQIQALGGKWIEARTRFDARFFYQRVIAILKKEHPEYIFSEKDGKIYAKNKQASDEDNDDASDLATQLAGTASSALKVLDSGATPDDEPPLEVTLDQLPDDELEPSDNLDNSEGEIASNRPTTVEEALANLFKEQNLSKAVDATTIGVRALGERAKRTWDATKNTREETLDATRKTAKGAKAKLNKYLDEGTIKKTINKTALGIGTGAVIGLGLGAYGTLRFVGGAWELTKNEAKAIKKTGWPVLKDVAKTVAWHPLRGVGRIVATPLSRGVQGFKAGLNYPAKPNKSVGKGFFGKPWAGMKNLTKGAWYRAKQLGSVPAGLVMGGLGAVEGVANFAIKDVVGLNKGSAELISDGWKYGKSLGPNSQKPEISKYGVEAGLAGTIWDTLKFGKGIAWDGPKNWIVGEPKLDAEGKTLEAKLGEDGKPIEAKEKTPGLLKKIWNLFGGKKEIGDVLRIKDVWKEINKDGQPLTADGLGNLTDAVVNYLNLESLSPVAAFTGLGVKYLANKFLPNEIEGTNIDYSKFGELLGNMKGKSINGFVKSFDVSKLTSNFRYLLSDKLLEQGIKTDEGKMAIKAQLKAFFNDEGPLDLATVKTHLDVFIAKLTDAKNLNPKLATDATAIVAILNGIRGNLSKDGVLNEVYFGVKETKFDFDYDNFGDQAYERMPDKKAALKGFDVGAFRDQFTYLLKKGEIEESLTSEEGRNELKKLLATLFNLQSDKLNKVSLKKRKTNLIGKFGTEKSAKEMGLEKEYKELDKALEEIVTVVEEFVEQIYADKINYNAFGASMSTVNTKERMGFFLRSYNSKLFRETFDLIIDEGALEELKTNPSLRKTAQNQTRMLVRQEPQNGHVRLQEFKNTLEGYIKLLEEMQKDATQFSGLSEMVRANHTAMLADLRSIQTFVTDANFKIINTNELGLDYDNFGEQLMDAIDDRKEFSEFLSKFSTKDFVANFGAILRLNDATTLTEGQKAQLQEKIASLFNARLVDASGMGTSISTMIDSLDNELGKNTVASKLKSKGKQIVSALKTIQTKSVQIFGVQSEAQTPPVQAPQKNVG